MKKRIKTMWLNALRSKEYKQGRAKLRSVKNNEYCCLGVLTDLYCKTKKLNWNRVTKGENSQLTDDVTNWAGLTSSDPSIYYKDGKDQTLADLNDGTSHLRALSFKQIANIIEKQL